MYSNRLNYNKFNKGLSIKITLMLFLVMIKNVIYNKYNI